MSDLSTKGEVRRRRRILDAARRLIAKHGVEGLAVRRIAEDAEVSVATLYNLDGSKEQTLDALLEESLATRRRALTGGCPAGPRRRYDHGEYAAP